MNNDHVSPTDTLLLDDQKLQELVAAGLKAQRIKIHSDFSITVDGTLLPTTALPRPASASKINSTNQLQFDGKTWTLQYQGIAIQQPNRVGLRYSAILIKNAGVEKHSSKMVTAAHGELVDVVNESTISEEDVAVEEGREDSRGDITYPIVTQEFRDEILPDKDRTFVLDLLEKEETQLTRLKIKGWPEPIKQKELEIEQIKDYLKKTRFMGRNVCFPGRAESDRKSVAKAIKEAIKKIAAEHPSLAEHLRKSIKTGEYCSYQPKTKTEWQVAMSDKKWRQ